MKLIFSLSTFTFHLSPFNLFAQSFTLTASKTTVGVGESFQVDFNVSGMGGRFTPPDMNDFREAGSSTYQSISNSSSQTTFSYSLIAVKEGTFTIGPGTVADGNKKYTSNTITIKVVKGAANSQQNSSAQNGNSPPAALNGDELKQKLFIRIIPGKLKAYQGEGIPVTIKIYTKVDLQGFQDATFPDYTGFYCENIPEKSQPPVTREVVNGVAYQSVVLKQSVIFPQHAGNIKIDPVVAQCIVLETVRSNDPNDIFGQFFGTTKKSVYTVKSQPVTIDVMPLPNTTKEFSGSVGQYTLKSSLDKTSVKANDAVNLNVTISGDGELKLIDSIPFRFPADFDHYDPKITDHITVAPSGVSGSRNFSYVIIPRHQGNFKIPPVDFTYFDPGKKSYITLNIPEMTLDVAKGDNNGASVAFNSSPVNKEDIKLLGSDIRFIHTGHLPAYLLNDYFLYSIPFFAGILSPLLGFIGFLFFRRRYIERNKDVVMVKQRGATRMAKKRLKAANSFIASGNKERFYEELHKALNGYLGDKFAIPVADLSRESIIAKLSTNAGEKPGISAETMQKLTSVLDNCEFARYAPASVTGNLKEVYNLAVTLLTQLEDEIAY